MPSSPGRNVSVQAVGNDSPLSCGTSAVVVVTKYDAVDDITSVEVASAVVCEEVSSGCETGDAAVV